MFRRSWVSVMTRKLAVLIETFRCSYQFLQINAWKHKTIRCSLVSHNSQIIRYFIIRLSCQAVQTICGAGERDSNWQCAVKGHFQSHFPVVLRLCSQRPGYSFLPVLTHFIPILWSYHSYSIAIACTCKEPLNTMRIFRPSLGISVFKITSLLYWVFFLSNGQLPFNL